MTLLFRLAEWHALAKLRLHTESSLSHMEAVTTALGRELRRFCTTTCLAFKTTELEKEFAARGRKQQRKQDQTPTSAKKPANPPAGGRKAKTLNLSVYKVHALGDYARTIRLFGTTDSYSTQIVSCH
jgi:hypothetical protein